MQKYYFKIFQFRTKYIHSTYIWIRLAVLFQRRRPFKSSFVSKVHDSKYWKFIFKSLFSAEFFYYYENTMFFFLVFQNVSMSPSIIITVLQIHKQIFHNQIMGVFLPNFAHILQCYITFRQVRLKYIKFNFFYRHKINIAHRVFRKFYSIYLPSDFSSFKKRNLIEKWKKNISPRGNKIWKDRTKNCILIYRFVSDTFTIIKQTEMKYLPCTITYSPED